MTDLRLPHSYAAVTAPLSAQAPSLRLRRLPLMLVMSWLVLTYVAFLLWPINWPIYRTSQWWGLSAYVALCFLSLGVMFWFGSGGRSTIRIFQPVRFTVLTGAVASILLLTPLSILYTGRGPWEIMAALADQSEAYSYLQGQVFQRDSADRVASLISALAGPVVFAVIPLGVIYWTRMTAVLRGAVIGAVLAAIVLSIMRGTDRELANLLIVGGSALLVSIGRGATFSGRTFSIVKKYWKPAILIAIFVYVAAIAFTERKAGRLGSEDKACAGNLRICADLDAPALKWMGDTPTFGLSFFVITVSQGYYGLALGMEKDFQPTWGIGHSPALLSVYSTMTGDFQAPGRTYTSRNGFEGWSDQNYWSTMILWVANDVGFAGAIVVLLLLGFLWGRAWRDATFGRNDPAAVFFCACMSILVYLPANNQFFQTFDGYTTFFGWLIVWLGGVASKTVNVPAGRRG